MTDGSRRLSLRSVANPTFRDCIEEELGWNGIVPIDCVFHYGADLFPSFTRNGYDIAAAISSSSHEAIRNAAFMRARISKRLSFSTGNNIERSSESPGLSASG
jgi:hypothetical protein